jgi:CBS-domain-containing membrane protein
VNTKPFKGPQDTFIFRLVAFFSRLQLHYLHRNAQNRELITTIYLFIAGVTALATITIMAYLTDLMLLFPPLGPSAFILFYTPLAESASPRNLVLAHTMALLCGLTALVLAEVLLPGFQGTPSTTMNWANVTAIAMAMGAASISMVLFQCVHPPAAATALIAAMGYLDNPIQIGGVLLAVLFLGMEAYLFNRLLGGLPYPLWRFDPEVEKTYRSLTGQSKSTASRWQEITQKTFRRR